MAGNPWDKEESTPWDSNTAAQLTAASTAEKRLPTHSKTKAPLPIKQHMPEALSKADRAIVANFSNDPQASIEWLREKYPGFDFGIVGDQIGMRPQGQTGDYYAVVPKFTLAEIGKNPSEFLNQVTDQAYNIASGVASGTAALGAGALAAPSGPGALAAGTAAGGATGAAAETLRQQIGKSLGINKEIKPGEILTQGVVNAAAVPLFGAGKAIPGVAGVAGDFVKGSVLPKVGEMVSGVPAQSIRNFAKNSGAVKKMEKEGVLDLVEQTHEGIVTPLMQKKMEVGQQIGQAIDNAGGSVEIAQAKQPWLDLKLRLEQQLERNPTNEIKDKLSEVTKTIDYYFPVTETQTKQVPTGFTDYFGKPTFQEVTTSSEPITRLSARDAFNLKQSMADLGELDKVRSGTKSSLTGMSPAQKEMANTARDSKKALDNGIGEAVNASDNLGDLKNQYRDYTDLQNTLDKHFSNPEKTFSTMQNIEGKNKKVLYETMQRYDPGALKNAEIFDAYKYFGEASLNPLSTKGATSTGRAVPLAAATAAVGSWLGNKAGIGYLPGAVIGGAVGHTVGSPYALRGYMKLGRGINNVQNTLGPLNAAVPQVGSNIYSENNPNMQIPWTLFPTNNNQGATP